MVHAPTSAPRPGEAASQATKPPRAFDFGERTAPSSAASGQAEARGLLGTAAGLLRSTAFRLSLVYLLVFAVFAGFLIVYISWNTQVIFYRQLVNTIEAEAQGLAEQYRIGGVGRLVQVVDSRTRSPTNTLYLVTDRRGAALAGNVAAVPSGTLDQSGLMHISYQPFEDAAERRYEALVHVFRLPGEFRLLVGRDIEERQRLLDIVTRASLWGIVLMIVLGIGGGYYVSRRVLARIEAISDTSRSIMEGDLSERVQLSGRGDEFDRLAQSLNAMLERIEQLMHGLKEVSDNIAHDLKTPLTRLRGRVEAALRAGPDLETYRDALETTIEESDRLIATFNALLMIARAEAGHSGVSFAPVELSAVARDVVELYEPVAEEAGIALRVEAAAPVTISGNRELIGQAIANLVDNALKYGADGASAGRQAAPEITVSAGWTGGVAQVAVRDRGPGIPEAQRGRVIERFTRLEDGRSRPGAGLGLSLVAAVARLHGGALRLEDNRPGLKAVLALPAETKAEGA
jgi:signal transduction histidine kinase